MLRLISSSVSPLIFLIVLMLVFSYLPTFSSENHPKSFNDRTMSDGIVKNISSALQAPEISSEAHSMPTADVNVSSSSASAQQRRPISQSKRWTKARSDAAKTKRHRRHASSIPPAEEDRDEEERVPFGPIWTGQPATCVGCDYNEIVRRNRIESIKEDLLRKLKLVAPPNVTAPRYFSNFKNILQSTSGFVDKPDDPYLQNDAPFEESSEDTPEDGDRSTAMRVFNFCQGPHPNHSTPTSHEYVCTFTFQSHILNMEAVSAFVGIYVERFSNSSYHRHHRHHHDPQKVPRNPFAPTVYLSKILPNGESEIFGKKKAHFGMTNGVWLEIDAGAVVQSWLSAPTENYGMRVRLELNPRDTGNYRVISPYSVERDSDMDHKPFVDVTLKDAPRSSRSKRSTPSDVCEDVPEERECCRYPLIIDFTEIRWDFILQPKTYNAYFCEGYCSTAMRLANPHAHIQQSASENSLCCSPKLYSPLILVYTDSESRMLSQAVPGMIAERCGCS